MVETGTSKGNSVSWIWSVSLAQDNTLSFPCVFSLLFFFLLNVSIFLKIIPRNHDVWIAFLASRTFLFQTFLVLLVIRWSLQDQEVTNIVLFVTDSFSKSHPFCFPTGQTAASIQISVRDSDCLVVTLPISLPCQHQKLQLTICLIISAYILYFLLFRDANSLHNIVLIVSDNKLILWGLNKGLHIDWSYPHGRV